MELRAYTDADFALTEALETDPAVMQQLGGPVPLERLPRVHRLRLTEPWWFVIAEGPGAPGLGTIGIWDATHDGEAIHEAGWMVLPAHQGRGIASRALALLVERARTEPRFSAIHAFPPVTNTPSNALCRKAGFALLGETDVEFAGRPLHCNHWALALAGPGQLDAGFAGNGKKAIGFGGVDAARAVLIQPDGRIVLAGGGGPAPRFAVARLRRGGRLDEAFSGDGRRTLGFGGEQEGAFAAALQPDGRIVLAGDSDLRVAVARLRPDGALDTSFSSDGRKVFSWGPISRATAVLVLPGGKLLLAGFAGPEGGDVKLARLDPGGPLDTAFGDDGIATIDFGGDDFGLALARQPDGRLLVAGRSTTAGAIVARLRSNGTPDPSFGGGDGRVALPGGGSASEVLVQPDGKLLVAGNAAGSEAMTVSRLLSDGTPDLGFGGGDGVATVDVAPLADSAAGAALQPDGRIVLAGSSQASGDMAVARLLADGSPDPGFGSAGIATVDFGAAAFGFAVALQPDGGIVVAGQRTGDDDMAVARLHG